MKTSLSIQYAQMQLGIVSLRKHQIKPIQSILDHRDTLVIAPTSSGKSAIYQIAALTMAEEKGQWTLVVEPTLSLISDQVQKLKNRKIPAAYITSLNHTEHRRIYHDLSRGKLSLLYMTPEKVATVDFQIATRDNPPWLVVVDEAHCVLDWGSTFRPAYLELGRRISWMASQSHRPVIAAFTATAPSQEREEITQSLGMTKPCLFTMSLRRDNIILLKEDCTGCDIKYRLKRLKHYIRKYGSTGQVVVYCSSKKYADLVFNYLDDRFPDKIAKCHAYMDPNRRQRNELDFIHGCKRIMVATTAFGMGVDAAAMRLVVHFQLPLSVVDYYQQVGRAGRDGQKSHAVLLYGEEDIPLNQYILRSEQYRKSTRSWVDRRLKEMAEIASCARLWLLWEKKTRSTATTAPTARRPGGAAMKIKKVDAGIHTLELYALRLTYSQCQKCMDTLADLAPLKVLRRDPYNIDRTLLSNALGSSGIRLIPWQSHDCSNGIGIIINPNLLLDCSCSPIQLFNPSWKSCERLLEQVEEVLHTLKLEDDPFHRNLIVSPEELSLSQMDLTMNLWFSKDADLVEIIRLFSKGNLPRSFDRQSCSTPEETRHCFIASSQTVTFKAYDKVYDLKRYGRCPFELEHKKILRIEVSSSGNPSWRNWSWIGGTTCTPC